MGSIGRESRRFRARKLPADRQHDVARIIAPGASPPLIELLGQIGGGLGSQRRVSGPNALPMIAMAGCTGRKPARRVAAMVEPRRHSLPAGPGVAGHERHVGIIGRHRLLLRRRQLARNRLHFGMPPAAARIALELRSKIPTVQGCEPRRASTIASPVQAVTGDASLRCPGITPAQRDQFARRDEAVCGSPIGDTARRQQQQQAGHEVIGSARIHNLSEPSPCGSGSGDITQSATANRDEGGCLSTVRALLPLLLAASCKSPPDEAQHMPQADPLRGHAAIERVGCAACHRIPGVGWPQGATGPSLEGFSEQGLIAGRLPNRPDVLAAFVRDAPALLPGSAMPPMPLSDEEAHDVAAYLYASGER